MLIYFHHHKFNYNQGQLAPIFIVFLVVLIIMAMVMVNLSKVAFIRTDSSNAVDAGALASGSAMANLFNYVAVANSGMEAHYWEAYALILSLSAIASGLFAAAMAQACPSPCTAAELMPYLRGTLIAIGVAILGLQLAQFFTYCGIRKETIKGWKLAIKYGHQFSFINSGINSKLRQGDPPPEIVATEQRNNFRDTFKQFLDSIGPAQEYTYPWQDGQERGHFVYSKITIDPVDTFKLKVTALPSLAITAFLTTSGLLAYLAEQALIVACACWACCNPLCEAGCLCLGAACAEAIAELAGSWAAMLAGVAGLIPGPTILSTSCEDTLLFIITWIIEIGDPPHNRLVKAETIQHHQGQKAVSGLLWNARYPDTASYSLVSFKGNGEIYPPFDDFDASIIDTDKLK